MKMQAQGRHTAPATGARYMLSQSTAIDIGRSLYGAGRGPEDAKNKAKALAHRKRFVALLGSIERLEHDLAELRGQVDAIARGDR